MDYEMTEERQVYLDARGYTILSACPGSGKTTSIVKKLYGVARYCIDQYGRHTGFACLSFTNKACGELMDKYHEIHEEVLKFPSIVSTIDSFITQNVVLPFWYLCPLCGSKPVIINEEDVLAKIYLNRVVVGGVVNEYPIMDLRPYSKNFFYKYPPETVTKEAGHFSVKRKIVTDKNLIKYCEIAFKHRLKCGYITSQDALWMACYILKKHQHVAKALIEHYPYIIVDEAQDSSELQFMFFNLLKNSGLRNLEFVGDICQSIYDFRNARPEILQKMMKEKEWNTMNFSECRRSNQRIINLYSKLKSMDIPSIIAYGVKDLGIPLIIYKYNNENVKNVIKHFNKICKDNSLNSRTLLARGDTACRKLAGVEDNEFKYWKSYIPYAIIEAKQMFDNDETDRAFYKIRIILSDLMFSQSQHIEKKDFIRNMKNNIDFNVRIIGFLRSFPALSMSFGEWTIQMQDYLQKYWSLSEIPNFHVYKRKTGYVMKEMALKPVEQYLSSSDRQSEYHKGVNTIHAVKGASLDAVLLFLSDNSKGQNISFSDFPMTPLAVMTEKQRMIYVACSRARQFLAIAIPSSVPDNRIRTALRGITYEVKPPNLQGEFDFKKKR